MNIIVIPVYKDVLDTNEYKSLSQCLKILYKHPICLIGPEDLNYSVYNEVFSKYGVKFDIETFDSNYFKSVAGYNKLMLSRFFYERFSSYKYMLIYQLDAYVFKDELDYWCDKDYDYIGAMEYGMPPISGWGMGIDRMIQLLTNSDNIKDVVMFPLMKPENKD